MWVFLASHRMLWRWSALWEWGGMAAGKVRDVSLWGGTSLLSSRDVCRGLRQPTPSGRAVLSSLWWRYAFVSNFSSCGPPSPLDHLVLEHASIVGRLLVCYKRADYLCLQLQKACKLSSCEIVKNQFIFWTVPFVELTTWCQVHNLEVCFCVQYQATVPNSQRLERLQPQSWPVVGGMGASCTW